MNSAEDEVAAVIVNCSHRQVPPVAGLETDQDVDVGYLKLFVSTVYLDLSAVEQGSISDGDLSRGMGPKAEH